MPPDFTILLAKSTVMFVECCPLAASLTTIAQRGFATGGGFLVLKSALRVSAAQRSRRWRCFHESLEPRVLLSGDVLSNHYDAGSTGQYNVETVLTPANVASTQAANSITTNFGRKFSTTLDGQVYAQPLARTGVNIARRESQGVHNVLYVATMHDSLYAIDANSGAILWQDSFLQIGDPRVNGSLNVTTGVSTIPAVSGNNPLVNPNDVGPEAGILATPTIDPNTGILYLLAATQEFRTTNTATPADSGDKHFVQRLWAINTSDGSVAITPTNNPPSNISPTSGGQMIGDTIMNSTSYSSYTGYHYVAGPFVKGTGNNGAQTGITNDGWSTDFNNVTTPWGSQAQTPMDAHYIAFNALLQMNRVATTLVNGEIYLGFASHGDAGPYYGWLLGYNASTLSNNAAFVTIPTFDAVKGSAGATAVGGLWGAGASIASDGTYLYFTVGNGSFNTDPGNFSATFTANDHGNIVQLPLDSDYGDSVMKFQFDPNATQANINIANGIICNPNGTYDPDGGYNTNGYGIKVVDFFAPSNAHVLNLHDEDVGSGGVMLIPPTGPQARTAHFNSGTGLWTVQADSTGDPMLVTGGKEGRIYLINANNLGGFNTQYVTAGNEIDSTTNPAVDPAPYDRVLGEYYYRQANGNPGIYANDQTDKVYSIAGYFNGEIYMGMGAGPTGTLQSPEQGFALTDFTFKAGTRTGIEPTPNFTTANKFGGRGTTPAISSNGLSNPIIWNTLVQHLSTDALMAYDTSGNTLFNSNWTIVGQANNISNTLTNGVTNATGVKFSIPTVFNGMAFVGTGGGSGTSGKQLGTIVGYGLLNSPPPPTKPSQPDLTGATDTGTSNHDDITADNTPTFVGYAAPGSTVSLLIDGQSKGVTTASDGGIYAVTSSVIPDGTHNVVAIATTMNGASTTSVAGTITINTTSPALAAAIFDYSGDNQSVESVFTTDVTGSIQADDLTLVNSVDGSNVPAENLVVHVNPATRSATWTFQNYPGDALPDGAYFARVSAAGISDVAGNHPASDIVFGFTFLNGDANHDGVVNALDFNVLATNYGHSSATFSQGDFNYDGGVDSRDFGALASRFGAVAVSLPLGTPLASSPALPAAPNPAALAFSNTSISADILRNDVATDPPLAA
jgi:hypothetical protein